MFRLVELDFAALTFQTAKISDCVYLSIILSFSNIAGAHTFEPFFGGTFTNDYIKDYLPEYFPKI